MPSSPFRTAADLPFPIAMVQEAIVSSGICPPDQNVLDGVFGPMTRVCLGEYVQTLPIETMEVVAYDPDLLREWVELGLSDDWQLQLELLRAVAEEEQ